MVHLVRLQHQQRRSIRQAVVTYILPVEASVTRIKNLDQSKSSLIAYPSQGVVTPIDSSHSCDCMSSFDPLFSAVWLLTILIFSHLPLTAEIFCSAVKFAYAYVSWWKGWIQIELVILGLIRLHWSCWKCPFRAGTEQRPLRFWFASMLMFLCHFISFTPIHGITLYCCHTFWFGVSCNTVIWVHSALGWTLTIFLSLFDRLLHTFRRFDHWPLTVVTAVTIESMGVTLPASEGLDCLMLPGFKGQNHCDAFLVSELILTL